MACRELEITIRTRQRWLGLYWESLFLTLKFRPEYPTYGFGSLEASREWTYRFVHWYNEIHRHSALKYATPRPASPWRIGGDPGGEE